MVSSDRVHKSVVKVLKESLKLSEGQYLLIIADDSGSQLARAFQKVAGEKGVSSAIVFVPEEQQKKMVDADDLHKPLAAAIEEAHTVINCLGNASDCTRFRGAIISMRRVGLKIAHMPGVTPHMLATAGDVNYAALSDECMTYVYPLVRGSEIEIRSGKGSSLTAKLRNRPTRRIPVPSTGVIKDASWGNIPAGETYISPIIGSAEGEILIDGSLLKQTVRRGQPVLLTFKNGNLLSYHTDDEEIAGCFKDLERLVASRDDEHCWRNLAEIGIGVNPQIRRLSGISIIDEKKAGTAHIAIGRSMGFGGEVDCSIHEDMIFRKPTILVDNRVIIDKGSRVFEASDWLDKLDDIKVPRVWRNSADSFSRSTSGKADPEDRTFLRRVYETGPGQSVSIQIGDDKTSKLARRAYQLVPEFVEEKVQLAEVAEKLRIRPESALRILYLLCQHDLAYKHSRPQ